MDELLQKQNEAHNEEILARADMVYNQYKDQGYPEEICLQFKEDFIRENIL